MKNLQKNIALIIVILLGIILRVAFVVYEKMPDSTVYLAQNGILNLKHWNWAENPIVALNGEWEFYPGVLKK